MILLFNHLNQLGRIAADDGIGRHIFGHYRCSCDDRILADCHTRQDGCTCSDPRVLTDMHRFADEYLAVVEIVVIADKLDVHSMILESQNVFCKKYNKPRPFFRRSRFNFV